MGWMDQFAKPGDRNRPIGLNLVDNDDDDDDDEKRGWCTVLHSK
jgi:hypothetical protein